MASDSGHWMERAFSKNKGKFRKKAARAGKSTPEFAKEHAGDSGTLGKEARLAETGMRYGGSRKKTRRKSTRRR